MHMQETRLKTLGLPRRNAKTLCLVAVAVAALSGPVLAGKRSAGLVLETAASRKFFPLAQSDPRLTAALMPRQVDLSGDFPPAGQQGRQPSCTSWALAYGLMSYFDRVETGAANRLRNGAANPSRCFSPAFIHNQIGTSRGLSISQAVRFVMRNGCATLSQMPYKDSDSRSKPSTAVRNKARKYRLKTLCRLPSINVTAIKRHLYDRRPVVISTQLDREFFRPGFRVWRRFGTPMKNGELHCFHALLIVGYDDSRRVFKILNSWGRQFGDNGYCYITYDLLPKVVREAYAPQDALNCKLGGKWTALVTKKKKNVFLSVSVKLTHDTRTDDVRGELVMMGYKDKKTTDSSGINGGVLRFKLRGRIHRSQVVLRAAPSLIGVSSSIRDAADIKRHQDQARFLLGSSPSLKIGDTVTLMISENRAMMTRNWKTLAARKHPPKLFRAMATLKKLDQTVTLRAVPGKDDKLKLVLRGCFGLTVDETLSKSK